MTGNKEKIENSYRKANFNIINSMNCNLRFRQLSKKRIGTILFGFAVSLAGIAYLRQRSPNSQFPVIYKVAKLVDDNALKQIEDIVRSKGEAFPISIAVVNADKAQITVGDGSFDPQSGRVYKIRRGPSNWEISEVVNWKNEP
jgi:hypothetical protein